jgi:hypothetical protein
LFLSFHGLNAQDTIQKKTSIDEAPPSFPNQAKAGEFTPGKGFLIAKNNLASLSISLYAMARYVNQLPAEKIWYDHLDSARLYKGRNDIFWHRVMIWFSGYLGTPKFTYMATCWTVFTTQQTLVYGNLQYNFNKHFRFGIGITPNLTNRSLQGPFPFFTSTDRTMAEEALRGGFTNGIFLNGEVLPRLNYSAVLGNNLSSLGIKAGSLTRNMAKSFSLIWMPTTGEFGPRGGNGDFEHHNKAATRFGISACHSRENRFNNVGTPSPDNTQVRMSDGILFFETGALARGVTVREADYDIVSIDLGLKYKGFALHSEFYNRRLSSIDADGLIPLSSINDKGYSIQALYMILPSKIALYGVHSKLMDEFKRYPWEAGGGMNIYPVKSRSWRINVQAMYVYKSAAGGVFGLYAAGQTGTTITIGTDILI